MRFNEPVMEVKHSEMESDGGMFKRVCPVCDDGILLMGRAPDGLLFRDDCCIACGQRFRFMDEVPPGGGDWA
jgi:hypothetical protein